MITEAWQCLIFEAMESITSSLAFTAAVTYAAKLSTNTTDSSVQGLLGGIYYGVGKLLCGKKRERNKKKVIDKWPKYNLFVFSIIQIENTICKEKPFGY